MQDQSPRAAVDQFLRLCDQQRFCEATRYLDIPRQQVPFQRNVSIVRRLKLLLERMGPFAFRQISRDAGDATEWREVDPSSVIVTISPTLFSGPPIRLMCRLTKDGSRSWVFSQGTLERIRQLSYDRDLLESLRQDSLLAPTRHAVWCTLLVLVVGGGLIRSISLLPGESTQTSVWGSGLTALSLALWQLSTTVKHRLVSAGGGYETGSSPFVRILIRVL